MVKVVAVSGYKPFELGIFQQDHPGVSFIKKALKKELTALAEDGLEWIMISGQLGVELWAGEVVLELKEHYSTLKLAVTTPFLNQEESWNEKNKEWYQSITQQADFVDSITKKPYESPSQFRLKNQFLIQKSDALILVYDTEKAGSPKFLYDTAIRFQEHNRYEVKLITFSTLQDIVEEEEFNRQDF